jgi:DNA-binding IclR family transcriptional regulator
MTTKAKHPVRALEKTMDIVDALLELEQAGVTELADVTGYSKSLVHSHLSTLEENGYVIQRDREYALGLRFLDVGGKVRSAHDLYRFGKEEVRNLAEDTGELANMMTEEHGRGIDLYRYMGDQSLEIRAHEGRRSYLHCTALGKAILSQMDASRVEQIVDRHGLPERTPNTVTDLASLREELERTRDRGYAVDDEERREGLRCVAVPVNDRDDAVLGAISVSAPTSRMRGDRFETELPERVLSAVNVIELKMNYSSSD